MPTQVYSIASPISAAVSPPSNSSALQGEAGTTDEENPMRESTPPRALPSSVESRGGGVTSPTAARGAAGEMGGVGGGSGERRRIFLGSYSGSSSAATQARRDPRIPEEEVDRLVGRLSELQGRASPSSPAPAQPFPI